MTLSLMELEEAVRPIAGAMEMVLRDEIPGALFALFVVQPGENGGWGTFISNIEREAMIKEVRMVIDRMEAHPETIVNPGDATELTGAKDGTEDQAQPEEDPPAR